MDDLIVLTDNKEKMPWDFSFYGLKSEVVHLATGDYTIKGMEDKIVIERKRNTGEIATNFGSKSKAFNNELNRMQSIVHKYLILEFSIQDLIDFPKNSGIPSYLLSKIRINSGFLSKEIERFENDLNITVFFCNNRDQAIEKAFKLLKETYARYKN